MKSANSQHGKLKNTDNTETSSSKKPPSLPYELLYEHSARSLSFYTHSNSHAQSGPFALSLKLSVPSPDIRWKAKSSRETRLPPGCYPYLPSPTEKPSSVSSLPDMAVINFYSHMYTLCVFPGNYTAGQRVDSVPIRWTTQPLFPQWREGVSETQMLSKSSRSSWTTWEGLVE